VASVYYNRLGLKMALDADPSVIYAEQLTGTYSGSLHHADLAVKSPYNTYRFAGLPPGPIANPGKSALEAAMHPDRTNFLYFVSDGNGHHRFARNLEEHNRNVNAYRRRWACGSSCGATFCGPIEKDQNLPPQGAQETTGGRRGHSPLK